jgi:hypothetical protein
MTGLREANDWTFCNVSPPPKLKKRQCNSWGGKGRGSTSDSGKLYPHKKEKLDSYSGLPGTLSESYFGREAIRREQREGLESNHREYLEIVERHKWAH